MISAGVVRLSKVPLLEYDDVEIDVHVHYSFVFEDKGEAEMRGKATESSRKKRKSRGKVSSALYSFFKEFFDHILELNMNYMNVYVSSSKDSTP
ncbi:hypothetical protein V1478_001903 [Vespula squamosa]|uniref:Uncharacterized protein n=1 Tax=Vespula squamosa TaxID=30214 RepID=A0ABD2BYG1_VESSQ